ncbi:MAG: TPM domain-containing protein [Lachnospiraceae bacterium]|nr:TPM domain-containing protein [Lachnospiraceae bacterium]
MRGRHGARTGSRGMERWLGICLVCLAVLLLAGWIPEAVHAKTPWVMDSAGLLTEEEIQALTEEIQRLKDATGWDVFAATTLDTEGRDTTTYAELLFDVNCSKEDGILCLIDMEHREFQLRTFGEAIRYVTDSRRDEMLDHAYEAAGSGDYAGCLIALVKGVGDAYEQGIPKGQYNYDEDTGAIDRYREPRRITLLELLVAVAAAAAAGGITAAVILGKYRLKWGGYQYSCRENGAVTLETHRDTLVNQFVTHRRIPKNPPKSSGGSGGSRSTVHRGAGGRVSGGGGRKF